MPKSRYTAYIAFLEQPRTKAEYLWALDVLDETISENLRAHVAETIKRAHQAVEQQ